MQGEQEYSERIFLGWSGHGLVAGEYLRCNIGLVPSAVVSVDAG